MNLPSSLVLLIAKRSLGIEKFKKLSTIINDIVAGRLEKFHQKSCNHKI